MSARRKLIWATGMVLLVLAAAIVLVVHRTGSAASGRPAATSGAGIAAPRRLSTGLLLGVAVASQDPAPATIFTQLTGVHPKIIEYYVSFGSALGSVSAFLKTGAMPLVQLDPEHRSAAQIAAGNDDSYLKSIATQLRDEGKPVALSFGHEMNGSWYPWGEPHTTPAEFVAAWRHIHGIFQAAGARNVIWVWTVADIAPQRIRAWWPGSSEVNWVGINGYYWKPAERFARIEQPTVRAIRAITTDPVLLTEVAVYPNPDSAAQVKDLFRSAIADRLKAVIWFNEDRMRAWSLADDRQALAAFRAAARSQ